MPDGYVGRKVKCPACSIVTIVPDIPGATEAKAAAQAAAAKPSPPPAPPPPLDPLDMLAAAADGEVIDEGYDAYDAQQGYWQESQPPPFRGDQYAEEPRYRARPRRMSGVSIFFILLLICLFFGAVGGHLVYYVNATAEMNQIRSTIPGVVSVEMVYFSRPHNEALLWGCLAGFVVALLLTWLIVAARSAGRR